MALIVTVIQARDLPSADRNGKSDPFVVLKLNGVSYKTKVIKSTLSPYWGESFTYIPGCFKANLDTLKLEVWDWDRFTKNDLLGTSLLPLDKYAANGTTEEWITLNSPKGGGKGSLQLRVIYGDGKPAPTSDQQPATPTVPSPGHGSPQLQCNSGSIQTTPPSSSTSMSPPVSAGSAASPHDSWIQQQNQQQIPAPFSSMNHSQSHYYQYQNMPLGGFTQPPASGGFTPGQQGMWPPQQAGQMHPAFYQQTVTYTSQQPPNAVHPGYYQSGGRPQSYVGLQPPSSGAPPMQGLAPPAPPRRWNGPTHGLSPAEIAAVENAFLRYDTDFSGTIDKNELKPLLRAVFGNRMSEGLMDRYASIHFQMADTDKSGQIDFGEFLVLYVNLKQHAGQLL